jgi:CubicO group peptidase (beta-lactamase class C family)
MLFRSIFLPLAIAVLLIGLSDRLSSQEKSLPRNLASFTIVDDLIREHVLQKKIAGATASVFLKGKEVYRHASGYRDLDAQDPIAFDTLFRIASMTKPITSTAVMILIDEGKLKLDDKLSKFVPEFSNCRVLPIDQMKEPSDLETKSVPANREITIADLLTHTSGIPYGFSFSGDIQSTYARNQVCDGLCEGDADLETNAKRIAVSGLVQQPGSAWQYGLNTDVLGRVIEVVSGTSLDVFLRQKLFVPLGIHDTFFEVPQEKELRLSALFRSDERLGVATVPDGLHTVGSIKYSATFQRLGASKYLSGGAGLVSTAADYSRFLQMLRDQGRSNGEQILSQESVTAMTTNQIGDLTIAFQIHGTKFGYGFGVHDGSVPMNGSAIGTYSWAGAFYTYFWVDPEKDVTAVLMTQLFPGQGVDLWGQFQRTVNQACDQKDAPK